jgi:hypothetical protein
VFSIVEREFPYEYEKSNAELMNIKASVSTNTICVISTGPRAFQCQPLEFLLDEKSFNLRESFDILAFMLEQGVVRTCLLLS